MLRLTRGPLAAALITCAALSSVAVEETASAQPAAQTVKMATTAFNDGKKAYEAGQYPVALENFKHSYDLVASPNSHIYIARCQDKMGNPKEAFRTFQAVVAEAEMRAKSEPKYAPTRDSAKTELGEVAAKIGVVTLNVHTDKPGAVVKINGANVPKEDWGKEIPADPGPADITLEAPGEAASTQHVTIAKGKQTIEVQATVAVQQQQPPPPPPHRSKPPYLPVAIAFTAVGVVGVGMFIGGAVTSKSTYNKLTNHMSTDIPGDVSTGKTQQLIANIGIGVGAVGLAAGVTFFALAATSKGKADDHASTEGPTIAVDLSPQYAGVHGTF